MTDWGQAGLIGGVGFATVVVVLSLLALAIWAVGMVLKRLPGSEKPEKKGE